MPSSLLTYFGQRQDATPFLLASDVERTLAEAFPQWDWILPHPSKIFQADEQQPPLFGFPVAETPVMRELAARLERWIADDVAAAISRQAPAREKAAASAQQYLGHVAKLAENALHSNLLNDYHAVFWLMHSLDTAKVFASIPRRVSALDAQLARTHGDMLKYRLFARWAADTRDQMVAVTGRAASLLDGEEQRGYQFFRLLQENVLILTEEYVSPDLRELRSYLNGYLKTDPNAFRDLYDRVRNTASELLQKDRAFRAALGIIGGGAEAAITPAVVFDTRFQTFFFDHPAGVNLATAPEKEQLALIGRRIREFGILHGLRRGILEITALADGSLIPADRRTEITLSRTTRPMDFGRPGVVDPMVHRFGLIYDISNFSETLGKIARGGRKEEMQSYRHMLLFQRRLETIAQRHLLQFEKFLGDGAFYTTRRAMRLVRAAVEIQRFYADMKKRGFAFNKGLRIALNYGYYRLLPMKTALDGAERIIEFYGPGIVELSRLTTGKANKEIEDVASLLVAHGYDPSKVQQFFAPLARGVDMVDHAQHAREFYAYMNANGHLINEGIVVSMALVQELSNEIADEAVRPVRIHAEWGDYLGISLGDESGYAGLRLIGTVSLKGLEQIEVAELTPFAAGEARVTPVEETDSFVVLLRQEYHARDERGGGHTVGEQTNERDVITEIVICFKAQTTTSEDDDVLIGEWDPLSDDVRHPLRIPRNDFQRLFELKGEITPELLSHRKDIVREVYQKLSDRARSAPKLQLASFRLSGNYDAFVVGDVVEKL